MRAKGHRIAGVLIGGGWVLAEWWHRKQSNTDEQFPTGKFLLYAGTGYALASLPDWIEPSLGNPNHRQYFHSASFVVVLVAIQQSDWLKAQAEPFQAISLRDENLPKAPPPSGQQSLVGEEDGQ